MKNHNAESSASRSEKRVLWEVRRRYQLDRPGQRKTAANKVSRLGVARPNLTGQQSDLPRRPPAGGGRRSASGRQTKSHWGRRLLITVFLAIVITGGVFGYKVLSASNKIISAESSLLGQIKDLLFSSGQYLAGEKANRINVLLIAIGGENHQGRNLADTVMVASIRPATKEVALLSIPRDLYVQVPGEEYFAKINAVHAYGESQKKDGGPAMLKAKVEEITGQPIHYYARIDFVAFKRIVDAVGGLNITIDNTFEDYWHKITFPAGTEKMNGERALAYVRARYIEGSEGGDFQRAARQQQTLLALREKVFSVNTAFDWRALNSILDSLSDNIRTDLELWEIRRFFEIARLLNHEAVRSVVLSTGPDGVLVGGTEVLSGEPASVLRPRTGDYSEVQAISDNIFSSEVSTSLAPTSQPAEVAAENAVKEEPAVKKPSLEIRNGTNTTGLAQQTSQKLQSEDYEVLAIGNAANRATAKTTVYALKDEAVEAAKAVAQKLSAQADSGLPANEPASEADVLIILGADAP